MSEQVTTNKPSNGKAVAALVLGIISIVFCWLLFGIPSLICAVIGLILAISAKKTAPSSMATAGLVLSVIGLVLSVIFVVACGILVWIGAEAAKQFPGTIDWNIG